MTTHGPAKDSSSMRARSADALALRQLSEGIKWRNARAIAEVRDAVRLVTDELEATATALADGAADGVAEHVAVLEANDKLRLLDALVRRALDDASASATFIGDAARVQLSLARLAAADVFANKRRQLTEERRRVDAITSAAAEELASRIQQLVDLNPQKPRTP